MTRLPKALSHEGFDDGARWEWLSPERHSQNFSQLGSLRRKNESLVISTKLRMAKPMPFVQKRFLRPDYRLRRSRPGGLPLLSMALCPTMMWPFIASGRQTKRGSSVRPVQPDRRFPSPDTMTAPRPCARFQTVSFLSCTCRVARWLIGETHPAIRRVLEVLDQERSESILRGLPCEALHADVRVIRANHVE